MRIWSHLPKPKRIGSPCLAYDSSPTSAKLVFFRDAGRLTTSVRLLPLNSNLQRTNMCKRKKFYNSRQLTDFSMSKVHFNKPARWFYLIFWLKSDIFSTWPFELRFQEYSSHKFNVFMTDIAMVIFISIVFDTSSILANYELKNSFKFF